MLINRIILHNTRSDAVTVYIEPWGKDFCLPSGAQIEVRHSLEKDIPVLVEWHEEGILLFGEIGSEISVLSGGVVVWVSYPKVTPDLLPETIDEAG
jgi:hypothetical protein